MTHKKTYGSFGTKHENSDTNQGKQSAPGKDDPPILQGWQCLSNHLTNMLAYPILGCIDVLHIFSDFFQILSQPYYEFMNFRILIANRLKLITSRFKPSAGNLPNLLTFKQFRHIVPRCPSGL